MPWSGFKRMLLLVLLTFLVLFKATSTESKAIPREFAEFLRRIGVTAQPRPISEIYSLSASQYDDSTKSLLESDVPEHSGGVITTPLNNDPYNPPDAYCSPRPEVIRVRKPPGSIAFPDYVTVYRCTGSCLYTQNSRHCAVTRQEEINVVIFELIGQSYTPQFLSLYNHTECECDCIKKASDCDTNIQKWIPESCECGCLSKNTCFSNQRWEADRCRCECKENEQICDSHNKEWDFINCGCRCIQNITTSCADSGGVLNPADCNCLF